ncbi:acyltransferase family protein [Massilia sp. SYSU DXS3249]
MSSKFRYSLENFRGLAIIFVMISHLGTLEALGWDGKFAYFLVGNATAWFVFLSGYLFYYIERKQFSYPAYLEKKARFVVLPYLVLSVPAIAAGFYLARPDLLDLSPAGYVGWSLAVGGSVIGPLWFIPMITVFFLFSPLFNRVAKTWMIYPLAVVGILFSIFSSRPIGSINPFLAFLHFLGFYLCGLAFAAGQHHLDALRYSVKSALIYAGVGLFAASCMLYEGQKAAPLGFFDGLGWFNALQFGKLALLVAIFFLFERYLDRQNKALAYTAKISFGLFFIHGFYLAVFQKVQQYLGITDGMATFFAEFTMVIGCTFATVVILKRILGKGSRYVIGC